MSQSEQGILSCWQCGKRMLVLRTQVGGDVECPHCRAMVTVPGQLFGAPTARTVRSAPGSAANKSPATAAVLNFLFWGAGYIYAGRAWGWAILIPYILLGFPLMLVGMVFGSLLVSLALSIALAWHAYHMVKESQARN